ncbi:unnamed protein product [Rotaria magnacalcarata]|uniref:Fatty acid desaturase domain-containing protein n=2 Tax=Rotaria TaxID=231623 RepID=A0A817AH87_9BILA|nr:unnamed protein product [Rotaria magnacalcarata]CAF3504445.1 unnamed protein product [Rotaria socialis]CAF1667175.1 unnamed protein product [Rotaria magnacalcarata]CAF2251527.1 unnamed protein product [Rotaria magnacalcarata]CAF4048489.1 unnamed protein product [Rotaria magnacalcarata]
MAAIFSTQTRNTHAVVAGREIARAIKQSDAAIRQEYPFLYHQDWICTIIFTSSILLMSLFSYLYLSNYISAIPTIISIALVISFLHELEHDIIHNLYFKKYKSIQNFMFLFIWIAKLHISPWYRRQLHLKHHLLSGQINDAEERLIGLGLSPNYKRMVVSMHPFGGVLVTDDIKKDAKFLNLFTLQAHNAPMMLIFLFINLCFLGYNLLYFIYFCFNYDMNTIYGIDTFYPTIRTLAVCLCFPNLLRQACLVLMSNSSHYFGDIPLNTVYYQNQILDSWYMLPFQLFCFNFGATHIVHHYVPSQPFYIRHFTARSVKNVMIELGVRNNDFGILWRNNHYTIDPKVDGKQQFYGKCWFAACIVLGFPLYIIWDIMILRKLNKNIINLISEKLSKQNIKEHDFNNNNVLLTDEKMVNNGEAIIGNGTSQLNSLTNRMALHYVSQDQIEEIGDKALET